MDCSSSSSHGDWSSWHCIATLLPLIALHCHSACTALSTALPPCLYYHPAAMQCGSILNWMNCRKVENCTCKVFCKLVTALNCCMYVGRCNCLKTKSAASSSAAAAAATIDCAPKTWKPFVWFEGTDHILTSLVAASVKSWKPVRLTVRAALNFPVPQNPNFRQSEITTVA